MENFNVGQEITLYSRTFKITVSIIMNEKVCAILREISLHAGDNYDHI